MRHAIVVLALGVGLVVGYWLVPPEVVIEEVVVTETVQAACDELLDAVQLVRARSKLALGPNVGPADGVSAQLLGQAINLLKSSGVQNDAVLFERLDAAVTAAVEPCLERGTVEPERP